MTFKSAETKFFLKYGKTVVYDIFINTYLHQFDAGKYIDIDVNFEFFCGKTPSLFHKVRALTT